MKAASSVSFQVDSFLSATEIDSLLHAFEGSENKEHKLTGPVCSPYQGFPAIDKKVMDLIGPCRILGTSLFFRTDTPHVLHMDAPKDLGRLPYRAILLPLRYEADDPCAPFDLSFFVFHQRWFGYPAKFFKGDRDIYSPHNRPVYDYAEIDGLVPGARPDPRVQAKWLSHLKPRWLDDLTIETQFDWKVGSAIVFDSVRIHCSSDFRRVGARSKTGLSIFTEMAE